MVGPGDRCPQGYMIPGTAGYCSAALRGRWLISRASAHLRAGGLPRVVTQEMKTVLAPTGGFQRFNLVLHLVAANDHIAQRARLVAAATTPGAIVRGAGQASLV